MSSLSPHQIQTLLSQAAQACAVELASADEPFFKKLEWWLADGVFNNEPYGMFRTTNPYFQGDKRTVEEFLSQETHHRWDGMDTLRDLFNQRVLELLEEWVLNWLMAHPQGAAPTPEQWEKMWVHEWEEALFLVELNPRFEGNQWEEFLALPVATLVEGWREHAHRVAATRALHAARMVSRQDLEAAIIEKVSDELSHQRASAPKQSTLEALEALVGENGCVQKLEVAVYVHSPSFTRRVDPALLKQVQERFPLPSSWNQVLPLQVGMGLDS